MTTAARVAYVHRVVPTAAEQIPAFLRGELQLIQRAGAKISIVTKTAAYTIQGNDEIVLVNTAGGPLSVTLPLATASLNLLVTIVNIGANTLTVVGTVSGTASPTLAQWRAMTIACDGTIFVKVGAV